MYGALGCLCLRSAPHGERDKGVHRLNSNSRRQRLPKTHWQEKLSWKFRPSLEDYSRIFRDVDMLFLSGLGHLLGRKLALGIIGPTFGNAVGPGNRDRHSLLSKFSSRRHPRKGTGRRGWLMTSCDISRRESSGGMEWLGVWNCIFSGSEFSNFGA